MCVTNIRGRLIPHWLLFDLYGASFIVNFVVGLNSKFYFRRVPSRCIRRKRRRWVRR